MKWTVLDEVDSTQDEAARRLRAGLSEPTVIWARHQTKGRGRFGRAWHGKPDESLTMSVALTDRHDHRAPWLLGMGMACAAASALHAQLQWPNDVVLGGCKVGGILTELLPDADERRVPVIGVGINLNQTEFPAEIVDRASSMRLQRGHAFEVEAVAKEILARFEAMPYLGAWSDVRPIWTMFDTTPGKPYRLPRGEVATALGLGPDGELIASVEGETVTVLAADALFGKQPLD